MGKLIVIEGTDGSGKSTQFRLLTQRLENENIAFQKIVFPQRSGNLRPLHHLQRRPSGFQGAGGQAAGVSQVAV